MLEPKLLNPVLNVIVPDMYKVGAPIYNKSRLVAQVNELSKNDELSDSVLQGSAQFVFSPVTDL